MGGLQGLMALAVRDRDSEMATIWRQVLVSVSRLGVEDCLDSPSVQDGCDMQE